MFQYWALSVKHNRDIIMDTMASQITSLMIVYSTVYSGTDQWKHKSSKLLAFVRGIHQCRNGEFPAQRTNNAENVSISWRHHGRPLIMQVSSQIISRQGIIYWPDFLLNILGTSHEEYICFHVLWLEQNGGQFEDIFKCILWNDIFFLFHWKFHWGLNFRSNWQQNSFDFGNGLVPNRWQAFIQTYVGHNANDVIWYHWDIMSWYRLHALWHDIHYPCAENKISWVKSLRSN